MLDLMRAAVDLHLSGLDADEVLRVTLVPGSIDDLLKAELLN